MNKIMILVLALGLLAVPAFAQGSIDENLSGVETVVDEGAAPEEGLVGSTETVEVNESEVGAVPGDWNYGFKRFFENVDKFFTFDKSESARKHAEYGLMRAKEAHVMSGKAQKLMAEGKDADAALDAVEDLAQEQNEELQAAEADLEAAVEDGSANETEVEAVQNQTRNSIMVLQRVYEKAPEAAKDGLLQALNNSISNYERHVEKVQAKEQEREREREGNETVSGNETETEGDGKGGNGKQGAGGGEADEADDAEEDVDEAETEDEEEDALDDANETDDGTGKGKGKGGNVTEADEEDG
ncbi:MAG: DUF5667 domain-containing protein [Candidatus Micrarchaeota archaeon]